MSPPKSLAEAAEHCEFLQLVRLLERARPHCRPLAEGVEPEREAVRFKAATGLAFPGREIDRLTFGDTPEEPPTLWCRHPVLTGQFGPLPQMFTEWIMEQEANGDRAASDFLDIFHHRLIALYVRIHKAFMPALSTVDSGEARLSGHLASLLGLVVGTDDARRGPGDRAYLALAGLLLDRNPNPVNLRALVAAFFGISARVVPFRGRWESLESGTTARLSGIGEGATLDGTTALGGRAWIADGAFDLVLGPLTPARAGDFLPDGSAFDDLCDLVRRFTGPSLDFQIVVHVAAEPTKGAPLGSDRARLGWNARLRADRAQPTRFTLRPTA
ncbi:type VI secretion system baseplate subunit TssG [Sulfidibacter corallicola]|uniref:Type VI secretion system baseplate subunit TssG n=1 Tax=Sulfidibacter corallicola TaxID=2818388 RepID=A0A8A4TPS0_SULCO|nr:type VI secretion system baseplate subunit TssG [Sulfidibacter corallicola]QTD50968.1 type VI secretion system baseplate subunit TssG [Sulfidibacter corallicola]